MKRSGGQVGDPGDHRGTGSSHAYTKYPPNTRWRYFKSLPSRGGGGETKGGWVRVGSATWNYVVQHNAKALQAQRGGSGRVGGGTASIGKVYHPSGRATQAWNPASPKGRSTYKGGNPNDNQLPGHRDFPGRHPGGRTPADTVKGDSTNPPKTPPKSPPKSPPASQTQQEKQWSKFIGNPNTQALIPMKDAAAQAGLQYDSQIKDARVAKADQVAQAGQNLADIQHWYNHLQNMNAGAITANQQAVGQETKANSADLQAGLSAIGGAGNNRAYAPMLQGVQANDFARQMGANQDAYLNNQTTMLGQNEDAQRMAQKALDSQTSQSLDSNLQNLLGQRGQALTTAQMAIIAANNASRQGNFGNRTSKAQSIAGLLQLGLNAKISAAQLGQMGGTGNHGHIKFVNQTPAQKQATLAQLLQGGKDAQGNDIAVPLTVAAARAKAFGYDAAPGSVLWRLLGTYTH